MKGKCMKEFHHFVADLRCVKSGDAEVYRIQKELGKIRVKFLQAKGDNHFEIRNGIWKLIYCWMLGYDIQLGQVEAIKLVASKHYSEKLTGYLACSLLLQKDSKLIYLLTNSVKRDLRSGCILTTSLALNFLANTGFSEMMDHVFHDVSRLTFLHISSYLQEKAYVVLFQFLRGRPSFFSNTEMWLSKTIQMVRHSLQTSPMIPVISFLHELLEQLKVDSQELFEIAVQVLKRLVLEELSDSAPCNRINDPWLLIEVLRMIQSLAKLSYEKSFLIDLGLILKKMLSYFASLCLSLKDETLGQTHKCNEKRNSMIEYAVFHEVTNVLISFKDQLDDSLHRQSIKLLIKLFHGHDIDTRVMSLDSLSRYVVFPSALHLVTTELNAIMSCLYQPDWSLGYSAANLLCAICTEEESERIITALKNYMDFITDKKCQGDLIVKIVLLLASFSKECNEFLDRMLSLLREIKDPVGETVWRQLVRIILESKHTRHPFQCHVAKKAYQCLLEPYLNKTLLSIASYLLGEFGVSLTEGISGYDQFKALARHLTYMDLDHKNITLTAVLKLTIQQPTLKEQTLNLFFPYLSCKDLDLQQQALHYTALLHKIDPSDMNSFFPPQREVMGTSTRRQQLFHPFLAVSRLRNHVNSLKSLPPLFPVLSLQQQSQLRLLLC